MYKKRDRIQITFDEFIIPFGGKLKGDNRWVKLAEMIPWDFIEDVYATKMSEESGAGAITARIAFGAIFIKENENLQDRNTVEYIAENPYMQFFLGLKEFESEPLFDASMMVHFRKRFPADFIEEINKRMFVEMAKNDINQKDKNESEKVVHTYMDNSDDDNNDSDTPENKGKLVLDATCAPADVRYPSDLSLLNEARENTEEIIEKLWEHSKKQGHKTGYNRRKARKEFLKIIKQKKPGIQKIRTVIKQQIHYVTSNIETIGRLLLEAKKEVLEQKHYDRIMTICELLRQQQTMIENENHSVPNRIVSLRQPHIRPIVRGKAGRKVEFGQKLAFSVVGGYTFIEEQKYDNFNEGTGLIDSAKRYKERYGFYPEAIQADQIYRNRDNLAFCKENNIRLSGPKLGRPAKNEEQNREFEYKDNCERNIIEGRNGMAKRRFGLDLIMAYLPETGKTEAALQVLCMNVRIRILALFYRFLQLFVLKKIKT